MDVNGTARVSGSLYVGDLPVDLHNPEDCLFATFSKIGMVISIKVCRDMNTQRSLGYAYVNFQNPGDADRALRELNYSKIRPDHADEMRIMWANRDPNNRKHGSGNVFLKNLPTNMSNKELFEFCSKFGPVVSCKHAKKNGEYHGYGFVDFGTEEIAKKALDELDGKEYNGNKIEGKPFKRRVERLRDADKTFVSVYSKNIKSDATREEVMAFFSKTGPVVDVYVGQPTTYPTKYAIVEMQTHEDAVRVIETVNDPDFIISAPEMKLFVSRLLKKAERIQTTRSVYQNEGRNLYVKNLPDTISEDVIVEMFAPFGPIQSIHLSRDSEGRFRGFAFVCFETKEAADKACRNLMNELKFGRPLYVSVAQHKDSRHMMLDEQFKNRIMAQNMEMRHNMFPPQVRYPMPMNMNGIPHMAQMGPMNPMMGGFNLIRRNAGQRPRGGPGRIAPRQHNFQQPHTTNSDIGALLSMNHADRKNILGERLYSKIHPTNPSLAAKITGMLLEMETEEIISVLDNDNMLQSKVNEAMRVLEQHNQN